MLFEDVEGKTDDWEKSMGRTGVRYADYIVLAYLSFVCLPSLLQWNGKADIRFSVAS